MFHPDIKTLRKELNYDAQRGIFDEIPGVLMADETLSRVFDMSSHKKTKVNGEVKSSKSIPFPSSPVPLFQSEYKCETVLILK